MIKKLIAIVTIINIAVMSVGNVVFAQEINANGAELENEATGNFVEMIEEGDSEVIEKLVEQNLDENTGIINEENERILNEAGILDSQIEEFEAEELDKLEEECYAIKVEVNYYSVDDNGEVIPSSQEEVEEYIQENELIQEENTKGVFGMEKISAKAGTVTKSQLSDSGMFRESLVVMQSKKGGYVSVCYRGNWLKTPKCRYHDVFGVTVDNLTILNNNKLTATYQYSFEEKKGFYDVSGNYHYMATYKTTDVRNLSVTLMVDSAVAEFDFYSTPEKDAADAAMHIGASTNRTYKMNQVYMFFESKRKYSTMNHCNVYCAYMHQKKKHDVGKSVSVSVSSKGAVSFSVSSSAKKYYETMTSSARMAVTNFMFK